MTKLTLLQTNYRNNELEGIKMKTMQTIYQNKERKSFIPDIDNFEPRLFKNFIAYWIIRKSNSLKAKNTLTEFRNSNPNEWLNLIESNQQFRSLYGEHTAHILIRLIEESN